MTKETKPKTVKVKMLQSVTGRHPGTKRSFSYDRNSGENGVVEIDEVVALDLINAGHAQAVTKVTAKAAPKPAE